MWGRSYERPPVHTVTNSDDLVQQGQLCLIGFSIPNRRGGSCGDLGPNPNSPTKQCSKIGHSVRGDCALCHWWVAIELVKCVQPCPPIMDEGSYMCHSCQGSWKLSPWPFLYAICCRSCDSPLWWSTDGRCHTSARLRMSTEMQISWSKALGVFSPARDARA